ncbi:hypothetical protein J7K92_00740 [bacterium]|nr:hypothetical protein [bacterium]
MYLQGKLDYKEMVAQLQKAIENYAKRQMTWFKRDKRILWVKKYKEAQKLAKELLKKRRDNKPRPGKETTL